MNGCAVVYMPGLTGSSSGSVTDGSATSAAKREPSGDHTGSLAASLKVSRHGVASPPPSAGSTINRPSLTKISCSPSGVHENRPRSASFTGCAPGRAGAQCDRQHERVVLLLADDAECLRRRRDIEDMAPGR